LPRVTRGRDPIHLRLLQPIASTPDWQKQRRLWRELCQQAMPQLPVATAVTAQS
jgi:hypothetical protein